MEDAVQVARTERVITLTLNRPQRLNALDLEMGDALAAALAEIAADDGLRAVVITGAGNAFCAGGDLQFFQDWAGRKSGAFGALTQRLHRVIADLRLMSKPVIAAITGPAAGAGFSLAMACDLRIASEQATFKQAYTSAGLVPDGGWTLLVGRQLGLARTAELALLDPRLTASEALALGLVNRVVPVGEVLAVAARLAEQVAQGPTEAFGRVKALLNRALLAGLAAQLEYERQAIMAAGETEDFAARLAAFWARRSPSDHER
jgi:2-(1,2-epoxy-1,2-dihydrophenyl)acetyl-CoA isomerase